MVVNNRLGYLFVFLGMSMALYAQRKTEVIRYGDLDQWVVRKITESAIIGKETKTLYCVGPTDTIIGNRPFESKVSPWGSSNVMARVSGITKASVSVYPENEWGSSIISLFIVETGVPKGTKLKLQLESFDQFF